MDTHFLQGNLKQGNVIAICASGPSLTPEDCHQLVESGVTIIAVNSTWKAVPECDYIFAGDLNWWNDNASAVPATAQHWSCSEQACKKHHLHYFEPPYRGAYNSGQRAILFAEKLNATRIILLGYDCSLDGGVHWHGLHQKLSNPDQRQIQSWEGQFRQLADYLQGKSEVINCSRRTALDCFKRMPLEDTLKMYV